MQTMIPNLTTEQAKACILHLIDNGFTFHVECRTNGVYLHMDLAARDELYGRNLVGPRKAPKQGE